MKITKKTLLAMLVGLSSTLTFGAFDLVKDGKTAGTIRIPSEPTEAEAFAARELQQSITAITGAELPIVADSATSAGPAVVIGRHPANSVLNAELDAAKGQYDRFALRCNGDTLHIAAPHSSGIQYGVWEYLEQQGVGWLMPGRLGTYVPHTPTIHVPDLDQKHEPGLEFRSSTNYIDAGLPWMLKNNGARLFVEEIENGHNAAWLYAWRSRLNSTMLDPRDTYTILGSGHSYEVYLPIDQYYEAHPEWFGLNGGKRQAPGDAWQICFNNADAAAEFARNAMTAVENTIQNGIPEDRILLCVSPNDHEVFCQCDACNALIDEGGFYSSNVLNFANMVAEAIHAKYPKVKITYYIYHSYGRIPTKIKPVPGVYAFITAWTANNSLAVNNAKPLMDPAGNPIFSEVFDWFARNSSGVLVYPYYAHFEIFTGWPMQTQMQYDLPKMAQYDKLIGMNSESHLHWGTQQLDLYLYPKLMWNPRADVKELTRTFCEKAYGPAGADAMEFFAIQQRQMDNLSYLCGNGIEVKDLLPESVIAECDNAIAKIAAQLPNMDEATAWRTNLLLQGWKYSKAYAEAIHLLVNGTTPECQAEVKSRFDAILDYLQTEEGRYAFEARVANRFNIANYLGMVNVNLHALPAGKSQWGGNLFYGSSLKFFADMHNLTPNLWGFYLGAKADGYLDWHFKSAAGPINSLTVSLTIVGGDVKVSVVDPDGKLHLVADHPGKIEIPAEYLNTSAVTLRISGHNTADGEVCWLANASAVIDVAE